MWNGHKIDVHQIYVAILLTIIATVHSGGVSTTRQAQKYLEKYGYIHPLSVPSSHNAHLEDYSSAIKAVNAFQDFFGLNVTGEFNNETLHLMSQPRCGVPDNFDSKTTKRSKRYSFIGSYWTIKDLTYKITKYPWSMRKAVVEAEIGRAFSVWSEHTDLTFTLRRSGPAHMIIKFVKGAHDYDEAFDGRGGDLAHAASPKGGGDVCFDDAELWTAASFYGTNLFQAAVHEFGHSLGLSHTYVRAAVMAPVYRGYNPEFRLHSDDIKGIQALYGKKTSQTRNGIKSLAQPTQRPVVRLSYMPRRPQSHTPSSKQLCEDHRIDAIFSSANGETYLLKDDLYYKIDKWVPWKNGYPKHISVGWPGLPGNVDAAFTHSNGKTYFFKGQQYWLYTGHRMDDGYPKMISETFIGVPNNLDAAIYWRTRNQILFFKNDEFIAFYAGTNTFSSPYQIISLGLPNNLDAAFEDSDGSVYFFKGDSYYDSVSDNMSLAFPHKTEFWLSMNSICF